MRNEKYLLENFATVRVGISSKSNGSMKQLDGSIDVANIKRFLKEKKLPESVAFMHQVHGKSIAIVSDRKQEIIPEVDGLITKTKNLNVCILTADCLPIFFYDPQQEVVAAVHAGSKGLLKNIIHECITVFKKEFRSESKNIVVSIGPNIEKKCYEVGSEMIEQFEKEFTWFDTSFYDNAKKDHYYLDLRKIALQSLRKEGILSEHIEISDLCTKCEVDSLYSYRRGDRNERFVNVISLV